MKEVEEKREKEAAEQEKVKQGNFQVEMTLKLKKRSKR
jgi:hypothetical protein